MNGGGACGLEWEENARDAIRVAVATRVAVDYEEGDEEEAAELDEDDNEEVIASLDSLTSSHQSSSLLGDRTNRIQIIPPQVPTAPMTTTTTAVAGITGASNNTATSAANSSFPRLIPARYRIRDFLLGDFSFNDDGER